MVELNSTSLLDRTAAYARKHMKRLRTRLECAIQTGEVEAVHDLRVASRRLREPLELVAPWAGNRPCKKARKRLRAIRSSFRRLRDLDVLLNTLAGSRASQGLTAADLTELIKAVKALRDQALQKSRQRCVIAHGRSVFDDVGGLLRKARKRLAGAEADLDRRGHEWLRSRAGSLLAAEPGLETTQDLHQVRIHAKRLRYSWELFAGINSESHDPLLDQLIRLQELLGRWNDQLFAARQLARLSVRRPLLGRETSYAGRVLLYAGRQASGADETRNKVIELWPSVVTAIHSFIPLTPEAGPAAEASSAAAPAVPEPQPVTGS